MAETKITQADIDNLATKLDQQLSGLSDKEKAMLHGVFALAGSAIDKARVGSKSKGEPTLSMTGPIGALSGGFKDAFRPGQSAKLDLSNLRNKAGGPDPDGLITWTRGGVAIGI